MTMNEDMKTLVQKAARGDELAFENLVKKHQDLVYNTALRMCGNREDALDISQETFIKVWRGLPKFRFECSFSTWVYRITVNAAKDHFEKKRSELQTVELSEVSDISAGELPDELAIKNDKAYALKIAVSKLSLEHREIITLREIEGLSYCEIAEILQIEQGTVKSRINRARSALKKILDEVEQK